MGFRMYFLRQHFRVTSALVIREMEARFGSKPGGYIWAIADPLAHVMTMTALFSILARVPALGTDFALFFASGYLPFAFYQAMTSYVAATVKANKQLFSYPIVSPIDAVTARYILQLMTSIAVTIVVLAICTTEIRHIGDLDLWTAIQASTLASLMGLGLGMANIALFGAFPLYEQIFNMVNRPLFMVSGVILVPDSMPHPIYDYMMWNPLVHVIMWFRSAIYPEYGAIGLDKMFVVKTVIILIFFGLSLFTGSRMLREERL